MAELKTKANDENVQTFIANIADTNKRAACHQVLALMQEVTGNKPTMWGDSMVGFGCYHYKYDSGHEGDWFVTGFAPRKQNFTIYIMPGFSHFATLMAKLGKYKTGKSCLYIKKLEDIDMTVLKELVTQSVQYMNKHYQCE